MAGNHTPQLLIMYRVTTTLAAHGQMLLWSLLVQYHRPLQFALLWQIAYIDLPVRVVGYKERGDG